MKDETEPATDAAEPDTILDIIERNTGRAPGVSLPEDESHVGSSPIALDPSMGVRFSARMRGDYQVLGEVARGGMGAILRAHDKDLRRDVAIKVLDEKLAKRPDIVQRFVEEAQIGGQLQHPGVVPVYELGLMADDRPFFTMKLIKGRTLASLLNARKSPANDLRSFLATFEQICQTLAYAHSKRVIHRDLKPSNVMVGAFGEVQVVDWGLAKVLSRGGVADEERALRDQRSLIETVRSEAASAVGSNSIVGSIMGTPAYMPPEQARGEVDAVDERADVFTLGALLCEILTGKPPYVDDGEDSVVIQAARAQLDPARARIESSATDEQLQRLCLDCLSPAPQARPASAEEVSRAVHGYLSGTEERARQAQLDATEARVKVGEERKRRRLTVALAGTLLTLLLAVAGGYLWIERQNQERLTDARGRIDALQAKALEMQTDGRPEFALGFARDALVLAESEKLGDELVERLRDFAARAATRVGQARAREDFARRNDALFARLDEIDLLSAETVDLAPQELDRAYTEAFRAFGLDLASDNVAATLEQLRDRGVSVEIAHAIDDWARVKRRIHGWRAFEAEALTALAGDLDPDEDRMRVRTALIEKDSDALLRMARSPEVTQLSPHTIWVLVGAVGDLARDMRELVGASDELDGVINELLERAVQAYPGEFRFRMVLARADWDLGRDEQAIAHAEAARALRPNELSQLKRLANYYKWNGSYSRSVQLYRDLLERAPDQASAFQEIGYGLMMLGDYTGAIDAYKSAQENAALSAESTFLLHGSRYLAGVYTADELAAAINAGEHETGYHKQMEACVLVLHSDPARRDPERALALAQQLRAQDLELEQPTHYLTWFAMALANHWLNHPEEVLTAVAAMGLNLATAEDAFAGAAIRAVAFQRLGDTASAREWLNHAERIFRRAGGAEAKAWERSGYYGVLVEARALIAR